MNYLAEYLTRTYRQLIREKTSRRNQMAANVASRHEAQAKNISNISL